jgi:hypothetical protein
MPGQERTVTVEFPAGTGQPAIGVRGWNIAQETIAVK